MLPTPLLLIFEQGGGYLAKGSWLSERGLEGCCGDISPQKWGPRFSPTTHLEQRDILSQELGQVDVQQGPEEQDALVLLWVPELEVAGGGEHGLDGTHAIVVMVLRGELLRAQAVGGHDLLGEAGA